MPIKMKLFAPHSAVVELSEKFNHRFTGVSVRIADEFFTDNTIKSIYEPTDGKSKATITIYIKAHENIDDIKSSLQMHLLGSHLLNVYTPEEKANVLSSIIQSRYEEPLRPGWYWADKYLVGKTDEEKAEQIFLFAAQVVDPDRAPKPTDERPSELVGSVTLDGLENEILQTASEIKHQHRADTTFTPQTKVDFSQLVGLDEAIIEKNEDPTKNTGVTRFKI
jgi:hypothetical protein